jgi:multiple sugar transport system permease protein
MNRKKLGNFAAYVFLILITAGMLLPFLWTVSTALKPPGQVFIYPPQWIPNPITWKNFATAWNRVPFGSFLMNSAFVSISVVLLQLFTCSLSAYAFARMEFPGRDQLFLLYLATLMIPGQVVIIPNFILMRYLGWLDTYRAMILPAAFSAFGTFLLRQFFLTIPYELEEAARIDGCSRFGLYWRIIIPLAKPALASLAIFTFRSQWNAFLWPLIVVNDTAKMPIQVGLSFFRGMYDVQWELMLAGTLIALIPTLVVFALGQRYFTQGIALSGLGGR